VSGKLTRSPPHRRYRDEPPTAHEAEVAGVATIYEIAGRGFCLYLPGERPDLGHLPVACFFERWRALVAAAVLPGTGRDSAYRLLTEAGAEGFALLSGVDREGRPEVLWTFDKGKRSFVKKGVKEVHIPFGEWHAMKIAVHGTRLTGYLDGEHLLDYTLAAPVAGKVGVWSKTDSVSEFADYVVAAAAR
jgi:hypothetical protein